ncbi:aminotransferase class V-fold PLP-dependent enzyme [Colwellia sp. MB02u-18]|uniref:aminotransferase class V-fold PLP-dependent enzyme n=1 Tax=unclassified Colwellia TaxID=196834 RepID=UPI0015F46913|nr:MULTISPECIES: aminotransferase class V-fold PLP-dependent enzyme [unclassified Colwellia]MBA6223146.1 aminotransferase class V-fold PLP-dependent enzyme [Colwellia sp. MB3u-45]MBA6267570.1 aminotransferase class V-fold PLP-dependent enzyme [Colwellia sp. MB3u-43]MBA6320303.1 aminotransferase class V-fold PLP-dependent enzyme [Colwellia sp. MB02u-19]MBA6323062.1 aminotransferase class V-fold PLP-dependent enzyme [Colwellia sp. MB02u-18]MBA6330395.1 aminotransferase class V-fold PLP-dependent
MSFENYFLPFRQHIIGQDLQHQINGQQLDIIYADWTASGRLYQPIEDYLTQELGPYVANTHTETNLTGSAMTHAYHDAQHIIKRHVNACDNDVLITAGAGMTAVINKFQRILGLRIPERMQTQVAFAENDRPVVFITHMEHHSNQTSWYECDVTLEIVEPDSQGLPSLTHLELLLEKYQNRKVKIGSFSACSNVTGIKTPYYQLAEIMHQHGGLCFVDFAASAPYVDIDMHPSNPKQALDAIYFSPHKFLGGPGSSGVLVFNKVLYKNKVPDHPGGGTVTWTNPWGKHSFFNNIELREDGGTPGFLQCIKTALAIKLKDAMGVENIQQREAQISQYVMDNLAKNEHVVMLEPNIRQRLAIISFYVPGAHYNLVVRLLNDKFGVQTRGGCSCAGTYGHILLKVDQDTSSKITQQIDSGDFAEKPGWIRASFHPTTSDKEVAFVVEAINQVTEHIALWSKEYRFNPASGDYEHGKPEVDFPSLSDFNALPKTGSEVSNKVRESPSILRKIFG